MIVSFKIFSKETDDPKFDKGKTLTKCHFFYPSIHLSFDILILHSGASVTCSRVYTYLLYINRCQFKQDERFIVRL